MKKRDKRIWLCLAHMSGNEMKYVKEAFDTNWVVPLGPNVNGFEDDLQRFVDSVDPSFVDPGSVKPHTVVALSSGTAALFIFPSSPVV